MMILQKMIKPREITPEARTEKTRRIPSDKGSGLEEDSRVF